MAKVSLRVYNREIEGMIEASRLDEAIAHCQHILKTFPMYIETYRLLGKTYLEARKYTDAADIFQRALMAVPDDFVSHVGMSIIRDDEGKLDDAIWHMERAFEVQPSNSAIQGELRRLYGRRDGVEPPKIRLSRDALANMYSQGELFNQAIAEIRSVLADDPNRPDLQAMLARAYYRAEQKVEAAEMAAGLLKKYPYCLDALRVLVDVLPGTTRSENTQIYRHRLGMLDPYAIFATDSAFSSDRVADSAVNLERLDYKPGAMPASAQPEWASSLGIQLAGEKRAEATPAWLESGIAASEPASSEPEPSAQEPVVPDDSLPEWMRSAGWQESSGTGQENPESANQEAPSETIAQADIPDWLKSMAPPEVAEAENVPAEASIEPLAGGDDDIPDWLKSMAPAHTGAENIKTEPVSFETPSTNTEPEPAQEGEIPDWLQSMAPAAASTDNIESEPAPAETPPASVEPEAAQEGEIPDWLQSLAPAAASTEKIQSEPESAETPPASVEPEPAQEGEIPDWLQSMAPAAASTDNIESEPAPAETPPASVEPEAAQEGEIPDWLQSLAPAAASTDNIESEPAPVSIEPEAAQEGALPDWLQSMAPAAASTENIESEPAPAEELPANIEPEAAQEGALPDWLQSMAPAAAITENMASGPEPAETPSASVEPEVAQEGALPDWLQSMAPTVASTENMASGPEPAENPPADAEPETFDVGTLPDWLQSMTPAQADSDAINPEFAHVEAAQMNSEPEPAEEASFPDWLKSIAPAAANETENTETPSGTGANAPMNIEPKPAEEGYFPDWLKSIAPASAQELENAETMPTVAASLPEKAEPEPKDIELSDTQPTYVKAHPAGIESITEPVGEENIPDWHKDQSDSTEPDKVAGFEAHAPEASRTEEQPTSVQPASESMPPAEQPANELPVPPESPIQKPVSASRSDDQPFQPTGEVKSLDIGDDALGWLESLAAKQGANSDELLTKPQDRSEEMPDWLRPTEEPAPAPVISEPLIKPLETMPLGPLDFPVEKPITPPAPAVAEVSPDVEEALPPQALQPNEVTQPVTIEDDTMAWLERLAANQGAKPEELLTKPEDRTETTPDWIQKASAEQPVPPVETPLPESVPVSSEQAIPPTEKPLPVEMAATEPAPVTFEQAVPPTEKSEPVEPAAPEPAPVSFEEDSSIASWLNTLDKPEPAADIQAVAPVEEESHLTQDDLPDWLRNLEKPQPSEPIKPEALDIDIPDWLRQPAEPVSQEQTQQPSAVEPVAGLTPEPDMPAWMVEPEDTTGPAIPTTPEEWIPVDKPVAEPEVEPTPEETPVAKPVSPPVEKPAQRPVLKGTGMLAHIPLLNKNADSLTAAQTALDKNMLDESMKEYGKLIKKGRLLDEVIHDLREAIYRFPVDVIVWQTLGDAYMRANRLQDALDAYTKAEELLR